MYLCSEIRGRVLAAAIVLWVAAGGVQAGGQSVQESDPPEANASIHPSQSDANGDEIIAALVKQNDLRSAQLREYSALRIYSLTNLQGKLHARETVRMEYVAPDKKTFVTTSEEGSGVVRHMVLSRLIESETSAASGKEHHDSSITPANYAFRALGEEQVGGHHCYVVEAIPKRKDKYLFEGKVWIDRQDFAIVRIEGHPAKKLSFWITRADFVREYQKVGDFWLPAKDETHVDVKLYGKKILTIEHFTDTVNGVKSAPVLGQNASAVRVSEKPKSN